MRLILALILLTACPGSAQEKMHYTIDETFNISTGALLKHPKVEAFVKTSESWAWRQVGRLGLGEDAVRVTATVIAPLIVGKYSTRGLHFHWEPVKELTMRPDIDYYPSTGVTTYSYSLHWRF